MNSHSYEEVLEKVFVLSKVRGMNRSLTNIRRLCKIYNHPERAYPTIHVAGTNGKGSVCTKIAAALSEQGYVTGLYTSPHIASFRERIRLNGQMIAEEEVAALFSEIQKIIIESDIAATFFETATLLAFLYFQRKKVDIAVIETGLGGTWDATNVIHPLISVITSIGDDHKDILGGSLEKIAEAKAGIIKENVPLVIGPDVPYSFMQEAAAKCKSPLYQSTFHNQDFDCENTEIARLVLSITDSTFPLSESAIHTGLKAKPLCRFEQYTGDKEIIFDVAHNIHAFRKLLGMLAHKYPQHDYRFVVGFSKDKEIEESARLIQDKAYAIHLVSGAHPRLAPLEDIQKAFAITKGNVYIEKSIDEGVQNALSACTCRPEVVVIAGSFFLMLEARKALGLPTPEDPHTWYDPLRVVTAKD